MSRHIVQARKPRGESGHLELSTDRERLAAYLEDAAHVPGGHASAVVVPENERQVADALAASASVLVVGAQSSLTGGATPRGETVLSTARLRRLTMAEDGRLRAGAGITIAEVDQQLRPVDAMYPPGPTWAGATVGGTIATNAAGAATFKYGPTRAWVDALTVVLASGDVLDLERGGAQAHPDGYFEIECAAGPIRVPVPTYQMPAVPKVSAGYFSKPAMDLIDLFVGAEGTLGIITEATLRIQTGRPATCLAFLTSRDRAAALALVGRLREEARRTWQMPSAGGLDVSAIEHMDARSLSLLREDGVDRRLDIALDPLAQMGLLVTVELQPQADADALHPLAAVLDSCVPDESVIVAMPGDEQSARRLLSLREAVPLAVNHRVARAQHDVDRRIDKTAADVIVPFECIAELLDRFDAEARRRELDLAVWGHISDGNMHPNVIPRTFGEAEAGREAVLAFGREAIRLGGSPLAEHGVGRSRIKQRLMQELYGEEGLEQMRAVKRALDPDGRLAPGVLFPAR